MDVELDLANHVNYYHGIMKRHEVENLLSGKETGSFLLRKSPQNENYVISLIFYGTYLHYSISTLYRDGRLKYSVNNGTPFSNPREVCEHYRATKGGLKCQLMYPMMKEQSNSQASSDYEIEIDWFHGDITRAEDSIRLSQAFKRHRKGGIFLIRKKDINKHVLSLVNEGRVHRYIIHQIVGSGQFYIAGKQRQFSTLHDLVEFLKTNPPSLTGIKCQLTMSCPKNMANRPLIQHAPTGSAPAKMGFSVAFAREFERFLPQGGLDMSWSGTNPQSSHESGHQAPPQPPQPFKETWTPKTSKSLMEKFRVAAMPEESPGYKSPYQNLTGNDKQSVAPDLFVSESNITIHEELGKGHFGAVCMAQCKLAGKTVPCAVKYLTGDDITANKQDLLSEAAIMQSFNHPYIVRLLAVCDTAANLIMVLELAPLGPLRSFLKHHDESTFSESKILNLMRQVCEGMEYLASQNVVHRDLAARNVLLVSENFAKVSDFGMSRVLMDTENYYRAVRPGRWPLRWYSPEALCYYKFTSKCDVWSFGVVLWEAFAYGRRPYKGMSGRDILAMLERDERLDCPDACPPEVYDLMLYCWTFDVDQRPTFTQLKPILDGITVSDEPPPLQPRNRKGVDYR